MHSHWWTRWLTFGSTGLQLRDSQAEVEAQTLGDTLSDVQALVEKLAESQAVLEAEILGDTLSDSQALVHTLAALHNHWSTLWVTCKQRWRQKR